MPLVPSYIDALRPYEAGRRTEDVAREYGLANVVKLASNENLLGASPRAVEHVRRALDGLNVYPNS